MSRRFGKHNIIGSEAHQPRPMAYMRTGFVARPNEKGPGKGESKPKIPVDVAGENLVDLAEKLFG